MMRYMTYTDRQGRTWRVDKKDVMRQRQYPHAPVGLVEGAKKVLVNDPNYQPTDRMVPAFTAMGPDGVRERTREEVADASAWLKARAQDDKRLIERLGTLEIALALIALVFLLLILLTV